ncbi:MAG: FtsW/RodA/SpoVE family cell cycle protein [Candidatus Eisenbacteria bacterium]
MRNNVARVFRPERWLLVSVLILCAVGLVMVYSSSAVLGMALARSSAHFFEGQLVKLLGGLVLLVAFWRLDYHFLSGKIAWVGIGAAFAALLALALHLGVAGGATADRWLRIGGFTLQPSEFARVGLVVFLASYLSRKEPSLPLSRRFLVPLAVALGITLLVAAQPNLSMALLILMLAGGIFFLADLPIRYLLGSTLIPGAIALVLMRPYQRERVLSFLGIGGASEAGYQLQQSITAVGSGGIAGLGLGNGLQKYFYLPFPHTDFILGIVGEETGLIGITVLLVLYVSLIVMGIDAARRAPDRFGHLLAAGLTWNLAMNVLVHAMVNLGMGPVTGVPLPFLSCGGSALMANLLAVGILLSVARHATVSRSDDWSSWGRRS